MQLSLGFGVRAFTIWTILLSFLLHHAVARPPGGSRADRWRHHRRAGMMRPHKRQLEKPPQANADQVACPASPPAEIQAQKRNLWAQLSDEEVTSVVEWLFKQLELNLTATDEAGEWDNTVLLVETMRPNKTVALEYFNNGGPEPAKYARVTLDKRATVSPVFAEILVGPLPVESGQTAWQPLAYPFTKTVTNGTVRNIMADADETVYAKWLYQHSRAIRDITLDLFNGTVMGRRNDTLEIWGIDPLWQEEDGRVIRWDTFWNLPKSAYLDAQTILPTGLFLMSDVTGRDPSKWKLEGWLYNEVFYRTTEEFRAAYWSPGFVKLGVNVEGDWSRTDRQGPVLPLDERPPPVAVAPGGSRFSLDTAQKYVEWMGFSFYIGFTRDSGVALYDVRYRGERILYELGMQEALSHYAGNDPVQSGTAYLDNYYGFGLYAVELVTGYDCPSYATYLDTTYYASETSQHRPRSICLFESTADYPIQRHSTDTHVSVTKNTQFVVRQVATISNYDYIVSYTFSRDGGISVDVRATGFIQAGHRHGGSNDEYGFRVRDSLSGGMHDHVLNFKADFDILGTANTVELVRNVPVTRSYPWWPEAVNTMALERSHIATEDQGRLDWDAEGAMQVMVVNRAAKTSHGAESRGYRILRSGPTAKLTVRNSTVLANAARWAEHDLHITRQRDSEPWSSHAYNNQDVRDPPVDFSRFLDGEALEQEDLVVWLNLGMHHVPQTGDLPNTVATVAHTAVRLVPANFFGMDPGRGAVDMVRLAFADGETTEVATFGRAQEACELALEPVEAALWGYSGSYAVRKAGYNPNNPFHDGDEKSVDD